MSKKFKLSRIINNGDNINVIYFLLYRILDLIFNIDQTHSTAYQRFIALLFGKRRY